MRKFLTGILFFLGFIFSVLVLDFLIVNLLFYALPISHPSVSIEQMVARSFVNKPQTNESLSLDAIFSYKDSSEPIVYKPNEYVLLATGDVILARSVNNQMVSQKDFLLPFEKTADFLKNADITFINLESPLISNCQSTTEGMVFCGSEKAVDGLVYSGVDVATIANNHMADHEQTGINQTVNLLGKNNIVVTGNGFPSVLNIKGKRFGFLGYSDILPRFDLLPKPDLEVMKKDISSLRNNVDYLIVAFHWGTEYTSTPSAKQVELAHAAIDDGADLIIGNHPHWVQGVEQYKGKFITYAHGNFVFDQMWSEETREGVIGKYVFNDNGLASVNFYPVIIENYSQPRFATLDESLKILNKMKLNSIFP